MKSDKSGVDSSFAVRILIITAIFFLNHQTGYSQVKNAWVAGDGEKVFRNDDKHPAKVSNYIWNGDTIKLRGIYNEVLAFQVIVEVDRKSVV